MFWDGFLYTGSELLCYISRWFQASPQPNLGWKLAHGPDSHQNAIRTPACLPCNNAAHSSAGLVSALLSRIVVTGTRQKVLRSRATKHVLSTGQFHVQSYKSQTA